MLIRNQFQQHSVFTFLYLMRRLDLVGSACSSSVLRWMKTFFMVLASCAIRKQSVICRVMQCPQEEKHKEKQIYLKNLRSWFIVCFGIFGHQVHILGHSINSFIVSILWTFKNICAV